MCGPGNLSGVLLFCLCFIRACHPALHPRHLREEEHNHGCSMEFRAPSHCDREECTFTVQWVDCGERVNFTLTAVVDGNHSVWAAVGFSGDRNMGNTDVVVCWAHSNGSFSIHDTWNPPDTHTNTPDQDQSDSGLILMEAGVAHSQFICSFSRLKFSPGMEDENLSEQLYLLVASGPLDGSGSNTTMRQHSHLQISECQYVIASCSMSSLRYQIKKIHALVMVVAFMLLVPSAALIARYYRLVFTETWFTAHVTLMLMAVVWVLIGLVLIFIHTAGAFIAGFHQIAGILCICLLVIQPTIGFLRPHAGPTTRRKVFNIVHRVLAVSIFSLGIMVLFWGSYIFNNAVFGWMVALLVLWAAVDLGFIALLEYLTRTHKFHTPPVGYHKVTRGDGLSESEEEEEVFVKEDGKTTSGKPGKKKTGETKKPEMFCLEKILLSAFVGQSFVFATIFGGLIFFFDSHGDRM